LRLDVERLVTATSRLAKRAGASKFALSHGREGLLTVWYATASFAEGVSTTAKGVKPEFACLKLAAELLEGKTCRRCNHVIAVTGSDEEFCQWRYRGEEFLPGCGHPLNKDVAMLPGYL
jgi:hypothetical protein